MAASVTRKRIKIGSNANSALDGSMSLVPQLLGLLQKEFINAVSVTNKLALRAYMFDSLR